MESRRESQKMPSQSSGRLCGLTVGAGRSKYSSVVSSSIIIGVCVSVCVCVHYLFLPSSLNFLTFCAYNVGNIMCVQLVCLG